MFLQASPNFKLGKVIYSRHKFRLTVYPGIDHALVAAILVIFFGGHWFFLGVLMECSLTQAWKCIKMCLRISNLTCKEKKPCFVDKSFWVMKSFDDLGNEKDHISHFEPIVMSLAWRNGGTPLAWGRAAVCASVAKMRHVRSGGGSCAGAHESSNGTTVWGWDSQ